MSTIIDLNPDGIDYDDPVDPSDAYDEVEPSTPGCPAWARAGREVTVITQKVWVTTAVEKRRVTHADADTITLDGGLAVHGDYCREDQCILIAKQDHEEVWMIGPEWDGVFTYRSLPQ